MAAGQAKKSSFKTAALLTLLSFTIVAAIARYILGNHWESIFNSAKIIAYLYV